VPPIVIVIAIAAIVVKRDDDINTSCNSIAGDGGSYSESGTNNSGDRLS
jgi:hypothetical protein